MFERSEFEPDPAQTEQRSVPAGPTNPARLSLPTFFGEAKKVGALSGAQPDMPKHQTIQPK
ncbi:hypothetical protein [Rhodoferax saidenbachensis]|uniref:hypothetical protein n=1 Tax=Rhodoferax saidenbachensis TaxID=1484693 RepID=UPI0004ADF61E|nr:hypothetical protein [Rhodoferax saidenbachensis]